MKKLLALILLVSTLCFSQEMKVVKTIDIGCIISVENIDTFTVVQTNKGIFRLCSETTFIIG